MLVCLKAILLYNNNQLCMHLELQPNLIFHRKNLDHSQCKILSPLKVDITQLGRGKKHYM